MCSYNTMTRNNPDNSAEPASLEFKQSCCAPSIQPSALSEADHLLFTKSTIALSIISPRVLKGIPNIDTALQLPGISLVSRYPCDTNFISVRFHIKRTVTVIHCLGVYDTRIPSFGGRLAVGKYFYSSLVKIRSPNCQYIERELS